MPKTIVSRELQEEIRRRYLEERVTMDRLAMEYGLGDTTVNRIVNRTGGYQNAPPVIPKGVMADAAKESQERFLALMGGKEAPLMKIPMEVLPVAEAKRQNDTLSRMEEAIEKQLKPEADLKKFIEGEKK